MKVVEVETFEMMRSALAASDRRTSDFDLNPGSAPLERAKLRSAAVLVPIQSTGRGLKVVLTKRSSALAHHPGQVAFPGGKIEEGDSGAVGAALREAHEEIGLEPEHVEIIGLMSPHVTVTSFEITPVLGRIVGDFQPAPERGEVEEVFSVPFSHFTDPENYSVQSRRWRGQRRHYYTVPYGPYYVWGATARILYALAERLSM